MVLVTSRDSVGGRRSSIWRGFRRALLHSQLLVVGPVLLRVWLPFPGLYYADPGLRRTHDCVDVFPAVQRRLQILVRLGETRPCLIVVAQWNTTVSNVCVCVYVCVWLCSALLRSAWLV